jgi:hypothetical protein
VGYRAALSAQGCEQLLEGRIGAEVNVSVGQPMFAEGLKSP